ncbi:hypothetical protein [Reticulibacter mediterranei]|uniref:hypothetical protein n=1 Tax=Reticulibacter mediterranei TaxID=2778369 RepID=UPI001C68EDC4|nr:hypothetical protein [Reticulibacter mediterranei]
MMHIIYNSYSQYTRSGAVFPDPGHLCELPESLDDPQRHAPGMSIETHVLGKPLRI